MVAGPRRLDQVPQTEMGAVKEERNAVGAPRLKNARAPDIPQSAEESVGCYESCRNPLVPAQRVHIVHSIPLLSLHL